MKEIGLSLAQPLQASINLIVGTLISAVMGIPTGLTLRISLPRCFILAILLTMLAGKRFFSRAAFSGSGEKPDQAASPGGPLVIALFVPAFQPGFAAQDVTQPMVGGDAYGPGDGAFV